MQGYGGDIETGEALYPGASSTDNMLRWGFIRKVYGIVGMQLAVTVLVASFIVAHPALQLQLVNNVGIQVFLMVLSILGLIPLYIYKDRHPINLVLLAAWTSVFGVTIGITLTFFQPAIVIQAVLITALVVAGLTGYTFYATKRGVELTWLGPMLFSALWAMLIWGFIQIFFHPGPVSQTIYCLLGAMLFSGYIVFDTHLLIQRLDLDDYIWAAVSLYLDIINLFLYILRLLQQSSNHN